MQASGDTHSDPVLLELFRAEMEYELLDTGDFNDDRYFDVFVEYAKASPEDMLMVNLEIELRNRENAGGKTGLALYNGPAPPGSGVGQGHLGNVG